MLCVDAIMESSSAHSPSQITSLIKNRLISNIRQNFEPVQLPATRLLHYGLYKRKKKKNLYVCAVLMMQQNISAYGTVQVLTCKSLFSFPVYKYTMYVHVCAETCVCISTLLAVGALPLVADLQEGCRTRTCPAAVANTFTKILFLCLTEEKRVNILTCTLYSTTMNRINCMTYTAAPDLSKTTTGKTPV